MASRSTRPVKREGLAHGKPLDSEACVMTASHAPGAPIRKREAQHTDGPRRMALSERMSSGKSKGETQAPGTSPVFAGRALRS
jgi:hypothetical protein